MNLKRGVLVSCVLIFLIGVVSAYSYGYGSFDLSNPSQFLDNEWIVFGGIFLLIFGVSYIALSNVFSRNKDGSFPWESRHSSVNNGAVGIIAAVVAFFGAAAFVQRGWIYGLFGQAAATWVFLIVGIVMIIIFVPFFKSLKANVGTGPAVLILIVGAWVIFKFLFNPNSGIGMDFGFSYEFVQFYDVVANPVTLGVLLVIAGIIWLISKGYRR